MDGITCMRKIREFERLQKRQTPVEFIVVSGDFENREGVLCMDPEGEIRASFLFRKPLDFPDLQFSINEILYKHTRQDECILVVDNDSLNIILMTNWLKRKSIDFKIARNGFEAIQEVKSLDKMQTRIIMNCDDPAVDGTNTARQIREYLRENHLLDIPMYGLLRKADTNLEELCRSVGLLKIFYNIEELEKSFDFIS